MGLTALFAFFACHRPVYGGMLAIFLFYFLNKKYPQKIFLLYLVCFFFFLGYFYFSLDMEEDPFVQDIEAEIRIKNYPLFDGNKMKMTVLSPDGEKWLATYIIPSEKEKDRLKTMLEPGLVCRADGEKSLPEPRKNPNGFHYGEYLKMRGIDYIFSVKKMNQCLSAQKSFHEYLLTVRQSALNKIYHHYPEEVSPFIAALLFGDKEKMDEDIYSAYQNMGIAHLLAISGLHVSVFAASFYYVFLRLGMTRENVRLLLLIFLPVFAVLSGGAPSVNRAVFMSWLLLFFSRRTGRLSSLDALGLSFLYYLIANPFIAYHAGFQLSYTVTACILLSRNFIQSAKNSISALFKISLTAQLGSLPILLYHFYEFSPLGVLLNIFYVPLYSAVILPLSLFSFCILLIVPVLAKIPIDVLSILLKYANLSAKIIAEINLFTWTLGKPPVLILMVFFICFSLTFLYFEKTGFIKKAVFYMVLPFFLQIGYVKLNPTGEVTVIDVGQGDSLLIRLPFHQGNYLIDTGGSLHFSTDEWQKRKNTFDPGERIVASFLKSKGITNIDKLILTHGDADHIGSAKAILELLDVDEIYLGKTSNKKDLEWEIIEYALGSGIPVREVHSGMAWKKGSFEFYVLGPEPFQPSGNDSSIVILARLGGKYWLFTGDLEVEGEKKLMERYPNIQADYLKVGHHGSNTSTSEVFLDKIRPAVALISAGENNRYGHPHAEVLEKLNQRKITVLRTDRHGAITYQFWPLGEKFSVMDP